MEAQVDGLQNLLRTRTIHWDYFSVKQELMDSQ